MRPLASRRPLVQKGFSSAESSNTSMQGAGWLAYQNQFCLVHKSWAGLGWAWQALEDHG